MEKSSVEKINYLEKQAIKDIQYKISDNALKLTEKFLEKTLNKENHSEIFKSSIKEIEVTLTKTNKFIQQ